jgi:hypothetical protein
MGKRKEPRRELQSAAHNGQEYRPGDCVLINPDDDAPAYVSVVWASVGGKKWFAGVNFSANRKRIVFSHARVLQIGRIKKISQSTSEPQDVELEVTWFYRPEEAVGGRKVGGMVTKPMRVHANGLKRGME